MISLLEMPGNTAYTRAGGETAEVRVYTCKECGISFLRTDADTTKENNLHKLTSCAA